MVRTKTEVKVKIKEWVEKQTNPFTTQKVHREISPIATNIHLSPNRLTKYIKATGKAVYDPKDKHWKVRLKPFKRLSQD